MAALRVLCWALLFILRLRFPPGSSIATLLTISYKNVNKTGRPFRKGNVCIKIFVNLNRSDTKHCLYVKLYNNFSYNIMKVLVF